MLILPRIMKLTFLALGLSLSPLAWSASVLQVKGKKVMIDLEGDNFTEGQILTVKDSSGKSKGLVKIKKIKGNRAIAVLGKGSASPGMMLAPRGGTSDSRGSSASSSQGTGGAYRAGAGVLLGMSMGNVTATLENGSKVTLAGNNFSFKGFFDYKLFNVIWFRGGAGLEGLNTTGDSTCNSATCTVKINYLDFDFWGRAVFGQNKVRPWVGAGFALLFPMTKEATAIDTSSITTTSVFALGGGLDIHFGKMYMPIQIEYGLFPKSTTVEASVISARVGLGWNF